MSSSHSSKSNLMGKPRHNTATTLGQHQLPTSLDISCQSSDTSFCQLLGSLQPRVFLLPLPKVSRVRLENVLPILGHNNLPIRLLHVPFRQGLSCKRFNLVLSTILTIPITSPYFTWRTYILLLWGASASSILPPCLRNTLENHGSRGLCHVLDMVC